MDAFILLVFWIKDAFWIKDGIHSFYLYSGSQMGYIHSACILDQGWMHSFCLHSGSRMDAFILLVFWIKDGCIHSACILDKRWMHSFCLYSGSRMHSGSRMGYIHSACILIKDAFILLVFWIKDTFCLYSGSMIGYIHSGFKDIP